MGDHRALGVAGRARGVHDRADIIVREFHVGNGPAIEGLDHRLIGVGRRPDTRARVDAQQGRDAAAALQLLRGVCESHIVDQQLRRTVVEDVLELRDRQAPVQQHGDRAAAAAAELQVEEFDAVVRQQGHAVAAPDAQR